MASLVEEDRSRPESEYGKRLIGPREVSPDDVKINKYHTEHAEEQRDSDYQPLANTSLVETEEIGDDESCGAQGSIAGSDRCSDNAYYRQDTSDSAEPGT